MGRPYVPVLVSGAEVTGPSAVSRLRVIHVFTVDSSAMLLRGQTAFARRHGIDLTVIAADGEIGRDHALREGFEFEPVKMTRKIDPFSDLAALLEISRIIRRVRPDVMHANTPKGGLLGTLASFLCGVQVRVYHARGLPLETATGAAASLLFLSEKVSCLLAHRVFCVSKSLAHQFVRRRLAAKEKLYVSSKGSGNGVDARGRFAPIASDSVLRRQTRQALGIPESAVVFTFAGRIAEDKGIRELLAAWEAVGECEGASVLLLCGTMDEVRGRLPADIRISLEQSRGIVRLDFQSDVRAIYAASDVLVHPSHREGFPNAALEAAAMSLPVITTDATGCRDAVENGVTGMVVPVGDVRALAESMMRYLGDERLRREHGTRARERVLADFRPEKVWRGYFEEYDRLTARAGKRRSGATPRWSLAQWDAEGKQD